MKFLSKSVAITGQLIPNEDEDEELFSPLKEKLERRKSKVIFPSKEDEEEEEGLLDDRGVYLGNQPVLLLDLDLDMQSQTSEQGQGQGQGQDQTQSVNNDGDGENPDAMQVMSRSKQSVSPDPQEPLSPFHLHTNTSVLPHLIPDQEASLVDDDEVFDDHHEELEDSEIFEFSGSETTETPMKTLSSTEKNRVLSALSSQRSMSMSMSMTRMTPSQRIRRYGADDHYNTANEMGLIRLDRDLDEDDEYAGMEGERESGERESDERDVEVSYDAGSDEDLVLANKNKKVSPLTMFTNDPSFPVGYAFVVDNN
jgi:hypothetical protein